MACHFSPYGTGLTNLPPALPEGSMLIVNDRIPMRSHDPEQVCRQLQEHSPACVLLDLQRPPEQSSLDIVRCLSQKLSCPVGISPLYGKASDRPIFLPPVPADTPMEAHLKPWQGREIWLEMSYSPSGYTITCENALPVSLSKIPDTGKQDASLCCHYRIELEQTQVQFFLWRTPEDLEELSKRAQAYGVTKAVGLWQELRK